MATPKERTEKMRMAQQHIYDWIACDIAGKTLTDRQKAGLRMVMHKIQVVAEENLLDEQRDRRDFFSGGAE